MLKARACFSIVQPVTLLPNKHLHHLVEGGYQRLGEPERKYEFRTGHEEFRCQSLEERSETLIAHHVRHDLESTLRVFEVAVLDSRLDDVEGSGHDKGCASTRNRSDEVLRPGSSVVVAELVEVFFSNGRSTEKLSETLVIIYRTIGRSYVPQMSPVHCAPRSIPSHGRDQNLHL